MLPISRRAFTALACTTIAGAAMGQDKFPSRLIRIVVPYPPGGSLDLVARAMLPKLIAALGQPVIIENRGGAAGVIGCEAVARAAPDGYTILLSSPATISVLASLNKPIPYDPVKDFTPLSVLVTNPNAIVVTPDLPAKTLAELVDYVKKNPNKVSYATSGTGTTQHLGGVSLEQFTGLDWVHVPYKGGTTAFNDLLGGQIKVGFVSLSTSLPHVHTGKLRMLAVLDDKRSSSAPDVPTTAEALTGYKTTLSWIGALGPANLPPAIAQRLSTELNKAILDPEVTRYINGTGQTVVGAPGEKLAQLIREEIVTYTQIVKNSRVPIE